MPPTPRSAPRSDNVTKHVSDTTRLITPAWSPSPSTAASTTSASAEPTPEPTSCWAGPTPKHRTGEPTNRGFTCRRCLETSHGGSRGTRTHNLRIKSLRARPDSLVSSVRKRPNGCHVRHVGLGTTHLYCPDHCQTRCSWQRM